MKVLLVAPDDRWESYLYFVEDVGHSLDAMQALLDLKHGPGKTPPRPGSGEWNRYSSGLHLIVGTGNVDVFEVPSGEGSHAPTTFSELLAGIENCSSVWMEPEHRETGQRLVLRLPAQLQALFPDLFIHGSSVVVEPMVETLK